MKLIFCPSYEPLFFVLYLWNKNKEGVSVITWNEGIRQFCEYIKIPVFFFRLPKIKRQNFFKHMTVMNRMKNEVANLLKNIEIDKNDNFYFLTNVMSFEVFYIIKLLYERCNVIYYNLTSHLFPKLENAKICFKVEYIINYYYIFLIRQVLKISLQLYFSEAGQRYVIGIGNRFFKKYDIHESVFNKNIQQLREHAIERFEKIIDDEYQTLIINEINGFPNEYIYVESMKIIYTKLISLLSNYVIKEHPTFSQLNKNNNNLFNGAKKLPYFIPSELLLKNIKKYVIGFASASLISAATNPNLKAISLLNLLEWKDINYKIYYKNFLKMQTDKIIFITSMKELKELLI